MNQITIECPDDLLIALGSTVEQFEHEAKFALAAKLYELGRLSSGKAARLAGMDRVAFLLSLHRIGVAALDLDAREFEDESRYAKSE
jgi:predicted HTH domain antitoxin